MRFFRMLLCGLLALPLLAHATETIPDVRDVPAADAQSTLEGLGLVVETVDWRADEDWGRFAAVLPRSPWDYHLCPEEFFAVLDRIAEAAGKYA